MELPKTMKRAMGVLGERSVMRTLILTHYKMELEPLGSEFYYIHSVKDRVTQKKEIDIIESWEDEHGEQWERVHEVKCESLTLDGEYGERKHLSNYAGKTCVGTGNVFIETIQKISKKEYFRILNGRKNVDIVPEIDRSRYSDKEFSLGFYHVIRETQEKIEEKYNGGRMIWFVSYVNPDGVEPYNAQIWSEDKTHGLKKTTEGVKWKRLEEHEEPDNFMMGNAGFVLHSMTIDDFERMMETVREEVPIRYIESEDTPGYGSVGYLVSLEKYVFGNYTYKDKYAIQGISDDLRGGTIYTDKWVWIKEEKTPDQYQKWKERDWETGEYQRCSEIEVSDWDSDIRIIIGDVLKGQ